MHHFFRRKYQSFDQRRQNRSARAYFARSGLMVGILCSLGTMGSACPQKVNAPEQGQWKPVSLPEQAPRSETPAQKEQRLTAQRAHLQAKGRKFKAAFVLDDEKTCQVDADCTLANAHCCSCSAGGTLVGVAAEKLTKVFDRRIEVCDDIMCPQMVSSHPSCSATKARCENGTCVPDVAPNAKGESGFGLGVETIPQ